MMVITPDTEPFSLEVKRFYAPFKIYDYCPKCNKCVECSETGNNYFGYPVVNKPMEISFVCDPCEGGREYSGAKYHEWTKSIIMRVTAEEAK